VPAYSIEDITDRLRRRAAGDAAALDSVWAAESQSWRSYNGQLTTMTAEQRASLARREIAAFEAAMPDFRRESAFHPSPDTDSIVERSTWSGTGPSGRVQVELCFLYQLAEGRIVRVDMYADAVQMAALSAALQDASRS
jgi:ketosteroid isomerase-like protein